MAARPAVGEDRQDSNGVEPMAQKRPLSSTGAWRDIGRIDSRIDRRFPALTDSITTDNRNIANEFRVHPCESRSLIAPKREERSSGDDVHWQPRRTQEPDRRGPRPRAVTMSFSLTTSHVAAPTLRLRAGGSDRVRARCGTRKVTQITSSPEGACQRPAALARLEPHAALSTRRGAPPRGLGPSPLVPCAPGFPCARPHRRHLISPNISSSSARSNSLSP